MEVPEPANSPSANPGLRATILMKNKLMAPESNTPINPIKLAFNPLALVNPVRNLNDAIEKANSLPFGLAAYAFTRSAHNADRLANEVEVGNLSINHFVASVAETPFGGVKDSGYGREGGTEGLYGYTVAKNVSHKTMSS